MILGSWRYWEKSKGWAVRGECLHWPKYEYSAFLLLRVDVAHGSVRVITSSATGGAKAKGFWIELLGEGFNLPFS